MQRYLRARDLIELGALVQKSGLIELLGDDHATFLGAMLSLVARLQSADAQNLRPIWRQCGEERLRQGETQHRDEASSRGNFAA